MKLRVTQKHLREATEDNCLFNVAFEKAGLPVRAGIFTVYVNSKPGFYVSKRARKMIDLFDYSYSSDKEKAKSCRATLRKMLPTTVVFKEISQ